MKCTPVTQLDDELLTRLQDKIGNNRQVTPKALGLGSLLNSSVADLDLTEDNLDAQAEQSTGLDGDPTWDEYTKQLLAESCAYFAQQILPGPPQKPYNGHFLIGDHHLEWDELIAKYKRICVLAPRDSGKSYMWTFAYPLWKACKEPNGLGFILSATQKQAERILEDIKLEIETNPQLRWLEPTKKDKWSSSYIRLSNGHRIYARGYGTKVRGAHLTWIVVDDGLNDEVIYSEMVRKKTIDYFYLAITNMIVPGGQIVVVGTPFCDSDLYADLEKNPEYEFRRYKAIKVDGTALWPERYTLAELEKRRREIGTVRFAREFQCEPIDDSASLFPLYLFKGEPTEQLTVKLGMPRAYWDELGIKSIFVGGDFAMSSSVEADYTVIFVLGVDAQGNRWIIDIVRAKGLPYQEQLSLINDVGRKYSPGLIFLEANQMQRIFGDELIRTTDLPIKQFVTGAQKNSLDKGVPSLRVLLENHKFRIPRGDAKSVELTDTWINEMRSFTWADGKLQGVGAHDDMVMALYLCDQAVRQGAFGFSFGGEEEYTGNFNETVKESIGEEDEEGKVTQEKKVSESTGASGNLVDPLLDANGKLRGGWGIPSGW